MHQSIDHQPMFLLSLPSAANARYRWGWQDCRQQKINGQMGCDQQYCNYGRHVHSQVRLFAVDGYISLVRKSGRCATAAQMEISDQNRTMRDRQEAHRDTNVVIIPCRAGKTEQQRRQLLLPSVRCPPAPFIARFDVSLGLLSRLQYWLACWSHASALSKVLLPA